MNDELDFNTIIDRAKNAVNASTYNAFADMLGLSSSAFANFKKRNSIPYERLLHLANSRNISADWLFTGEGDMLKANSTRQEPPKEVDKYELLQTKAYQTQDQGNHYHVKTKSWEDFALVPFYDVEASAGWGRLVDQELKISDMAFRTDWLATMGLKPSHCALIKARGDSMEPTIHDGDLLLVDTQANTIKDDAIYIVQADHHLVVKRVQQALDGSLIIISDNKRYENQTIGSDQVEKVKVAGRVRWYGHEI